MSATNNSLSLRQLAILNAVNASAHPYYAIAEQAGVSDNMLRYCRLGKHEPTQVCYESIMQAVFLLSTVEYVGRIVWDDRLHELVELRKLGMSYADTAWLLDCNPGPLRRCCIRYGI